jgi:hypothetical protein
MKKKLSILVFLFCCNLILCQAQYTIDTITLYTPNGSPVTGITRSELGSNDIAAISYEILNNYPNADYLNSPTATYNCHSYAWNMVEPGGVTCWIKAIYVSSLPYCTDGSYVTTGWGDATKIFYNSGDHSAIKVSGNYVISKWGMGPLMGHDVLYGPAIYNMTDQIVFKPGSKGSAPAPGFAYPNPADKILIIDLNAFVAAKPSLSSNAHFTYDIRLYDGMGSMLRQQKAGISTVQLNVSSLPNGMYYLHIYDGVNSTPSMTKIVVHH